MTRGSSPVLVGREIELGRLRDALSMARTADRSVVLVSGEAGIGKSRLLADLESSTTADPPGDRPVRFLHAGCIEVGELLAYLPILDWLAELARSTDGDLAAEASVLQSVFGGADPSRTPASTADSPDLGRGARFQRLRDLLIPASSDVDVVAVIDDLHWADRSTLDVFSFLASRLNRSGVLMIGAYRSDELHRRHPLTATLAEIERHATLDHVRLEPLGAADVARQIASIEGAPADEARVVRIVELADGNPFHVEELLALDRPGPLPSSLRDLLAARLAQVDDTTIGVLREAAVIGRRVDGELLAAVSRSGRDEVDASLRVATDARILVIDEDGRRVRFRHALLREAVYDDVLPSDRLALHRRIATCLTERPDLGDSARPAAAADLARHWLAAGALAEAFVALLEAGRLAASVAAWAESRWALEEALALWSRLPDPAVIAGRPRSAILEDASLVAWYDGASRRSLELNRLAQAEPDIQADPCHLGRLITSEAWYHNDLGEAAAYRDAAERAVGIFPVDPPSADRASALATLGHGFAIEGRMGEALALLSESYAVAARMADDSTIAGCLAFLSWIHADRGDEASAVRALDDSRLAFVRAEASSPAGTVESAYFAIITNAPWVSLLLGRYQDAIKEADAGIADARRRGFDTGLGPWLRSPKVIAEYNLGRWDAALASAADAASFTAEIGPESFLWSTVARIQAARGAVADARMSVARAIQGARSGWADEMVAGWLAAAWTELIANEPVAAARPIRAAIATWADLDSWTLQAEIAWFAAWTSAELSVGSSAGEDRGDDLAAHARSTVEALHAVAARTGAHEIARWLDLAAAELARRDEDDDPTRWAMLADRLEAVGNLPAAAIARLREAGAILHVGDEPERAVAALRAALAHTESMAATRLADQALAIARAGRLDLDRAASPLDEPPSARTTDPWGLSAREREVLELLADGRTNRQIGEALFISDKTASVHVTHILVKLGVTSRTEAALLAVRAGIGANDPG